MSIVAPAPPPCELPECTSPRHQSHRLCGSHYMKWYRHGDPRWKQPTRSADLTGQRFGTLVALERADVKHWICVCDCGRERRVRAWCLTAGQTQTCNIGHRRLQTVAYNAAHQRLATDRGPASDQACIDCGRTAQQWSYDHEDTSEFVATEGAYSLSQEHYFPRCVPCHKRFDLDRLSARCNSRKGARV